MKDKSAIFPSCAKRLLIEPIGSLFMSVSMAIYTVSDDHATKLFNNEFNNNFSSATAANAQL